MIERLRGAHIPLFTQITVPYIFLALLIAAGGTYLITRLIFNSLEERFLNQLIESTILAKQSMVRAEEDLLAAQRLAANTQGVAQAVLAGDVERLHALVEPGAYNTRLQAVVVLDRDGQPLLSQQLDIQSLSYQPLEPAMPYASLGFVRAALAGSRDEAGDKFAGLAPGPAGWYLFVSGPIYDAAGQVAGAALAGIPLEGLANKVYTETLTQVSFYAASGAVLGSSLEQPAPLGVAQVADLRANPADGVTRNLGSGHSELVTTWEIRGEEPLGFFGSALAPRFLVQAAQFTRQNTLMLMVASVLLVVLVGVLVAGYISRPVRALKDAAERVAAGDLRVSVPEDTQNEIGVLAGSFNQMVKSLHGSRKELLDAYNETIEGWAKATDLRDHETEGHSRRVAELSVELAKSMGVRGAALVHLYRGALLHDIGKIGIHDEILRKPGALSAAERAEMQKHPEIAKSFIEEIDFLRPALDIPYAHHERWDGSGYPRGLKGSEIPLAARIFAVVDVWDALTSDRPYRAARGRDETLAHIQAESGRHFDPAVVAAFVELISGVDKARVQK
ncbi:MAG: HAMP domain-containing protein [Anaerolineales bacterium]|nr:HAMP domain-containing protein [Anaerolineales bacterium]